jgi:hypothetical protein
VAGTYWLHSVSVLWGDRAVGSPRCVREVSLLRVRTDPAAPVPCVPVHPRGDAGVLPPWNVSWNGCGGRVYSRQERGTFSTRCRESARPARCFRRVPAAYREADPYGDSSRQGVVRFACFSDWRALSLVAGGDRRRFTAGCDAEPTNDRIRIRRGVLLPRCWSREAIA